MRINNSYYESQEANPIMLENICENNKIHDYEKKSLEVNLEKPSNTKLLNQIR